MLGNVRAERDAGSLERESRSFRIRVNAIKLFSQSMPQSGRAVDVNF